MRFFDDLEFVSGGRPQQCIVHSDTCWPDFFCFMFIPVGPLYFGIDGGEQSILEGPHAFWHHPDLSYQYGPVNQHWAHNWVSFKGPRGRRLIEEGLMPLASCGFVPVSQPAVFAEAFKELVPLVHVRDPARHPRGVLILENLLKILLDDGLRHVQESPYAGHFSEISAAILEQPGQTVNFQLEAQRVGISYSHFRRAFKEHSGRSPYEFLLHCRMQYAARALRETERPVKAIAQQLGYYDPAQFCKMFSRKIGLSPARFRRGMP
jgi:AraC-like DNA-binding protein